MKCIACASDETKVTDSRIAADGYTIRRRRECEKCGFRFSTNEHVEILNLTVLKQSGDKQSYSREKLITGVKKALEKRQVSDERLYRLILDIERRIQLNATSATNGEEDSPRMEITSRAIGDLVMRGLKRFDKVAYIRFASVYHAFADLGTFQKEIDLLIPKRRARKVRA